MTETEFNALAAQGYNRIPVSLETFADLDTPLSIYMKLANGPYTYLLESVQGGERFGRYSIIGLASPTRIVVNAHQVLVLTGNRISEREDDTNPLEFIGKFMKRFRAAPSTGLPRFCGGLVGCFGYDTVRYIETKLTRTRKTDDLGVPDIVLLLSVLGSSPLEYCTFSNHATMFSASADRSMAVFSATKVTVSVDDAVADAGVKV